MDDGKQAPDVETNNRAEWIVHVRDAVLGRPLNLIIAASGGRVVVVPPAAVGYVVPPKSIERYCDALHAAHNVAAHQTLIAGMDAER